jgi:hypothetical protein
VGEDGGITTTRDNLNGDHVIRKKIPFPAQEVIPVQEVLPTPRIVAPFFNHVLVDLRIVVLFLRVNHVQGVLSPQEMIGRRTHLLLALGVMILLPEVLFLQELLRLIIHQQGYHLKLLPQYLILTLISNLFLEEAQPLTLINRN